MQNDNTDRTELVADSEHIAEDVSDMFPELDEATKAKIVDMIETYIEVSIETVLENPEWFEEEEEGKNVKRHSMERNTKEMRSQFTKDKSAANVRRPKPAPNVLGGFNRDSTKTQGGI